jgi:hypothetical protein
MKIFRRVEFQVYSFFAVDSRWNRLVRFTNRELYYRQRTTDTNGIWGYVCRQGVLIVCAKEERSTQCQGIDPRFTCLSARNMVTVMSELPWHQLLGYFLCFKGKLVTLLRKYHARGRVCVCPSSFHASNHLTDFDEILRECFAHAGCLLVSYKHYWQQVDNGTCEASRTLVSVSVASRNDVR